MPNTRHHHVHSRAGSLRGRVVGDDCATGYGSGLVAAASMAFWVASDVEALVVLDDLGLDARVGECVGLIP